MDHPELADPRNLENFRIPIPRGSCDLIKRSIDSFSGGGLLRSRNFLSLVRGAVGLMKTNPDRYATKAVCYWHSFFGQLFDNRKDTSFIRFVCLFVDLMWLVRVTVAVTSVIRESCQ